ncbi:UDP-N-acetylmuramate dehydrogenase [Alphaproteobacteria bacterium]|nr:UDP-N-acetylmuramate dehydrogenase [Alphaproteobacteria bacterium]
MNINSFRNNFSNLVQFDHELAKFTWFGVGGNAEILFIAEDIISLSNVLKNKPKETNILIIGAGSNLLIRDKGFRGIVLHTKKLNKIKIDENQIITAEAGAIDAEVARFARNNLRGGLEFLLGIPGTIGGGIRMNSGAFGSEFKDILIDVKAINHSGVFRTFSNKELVMKYREIGISDEWIFCSARLMTYKDQKINIENKMKEIIALRKEAQPTGVKTGGSTFKNPIGNKAWKLIDEAGCRGFKIGGAMISEKHCNFIINSKKSTARDIEDLGEYVIDKVKKTSGVELSWEIKRVGTK